MSCHLTYSVTVGIQWQYESHESYGQHSVNLEIFRTVYRILFVPEYYIIYSQQISLQNFYANFYTPFLLIFLLSLFLQTFTSGVILYEIGLTPKWAHLAYQNFMFISSTESKLVWRRLLSILLHNNRMMSDVISHQSDLGTVLGVFCRSQWPRGVRRRYWPLGYWNRGFESLLGRGCLSLCFCVLLSCLGRGLLDGLITHPEESSHLSEWNYETFGVRLPRSLQGL
jgi:hypothetical protein